MKMKNKIVSMVFLVCVVSSVVWVSESFGEVNSPNSPYLIDGYAAIVIEFDPDPLYEDDGIVNCRYTVTVTDPDIQGFLVGGTFSDGSGTYPLLNFGGLFGAGTSDTKGGSFIKGIVLYSPGDVLTIEVEATLFPSIGDPFKETKSKSITVLSRAAGEDPINTGDDGIDPGEYIYDRVANSPISIIAGVNSFIIIFLLTAILAIVIFYIRRKG